MLSPYRVVESLSQIIQILPEKHPLITWAAEYVDDWKQASGDPDALADRESAALRRMINVALSASDDPYCRALALSVLCSRQGEAYLEKPVRSEVRLRPFEDICDLADKADEPILEYWLADAALGLAERQKPSYAGELEVLAWRLGCRLRETVAVAIEFYVHQLFTTDHDTITHASYTVPARLALVRHLRTLQPDTYEELFTTIEARCAAAAAIHDADQGRRQGVLLQASLVEQRYTTFVSQFSRALETGEEPPAKVLHNFVWYHDWLADPLRTLADAFLLVGMPDKALEVLEKATELDSYDGAANDRALIRKVLRRCYSIGDRNG